MFPATPGPSQTSTEVFFRKARLWDGEGRDAPPAFHVDGVQYLHVKVFGRGGDQGPLEGLGARPEPEVATSPVWVSVWRAAAVAAAPPALPCSLCCRCRRVGCTGWPAAAKTCPPAWCWNCCCASTLSAATTLATSARRWVGGWGWGKGGGGIAAGPSPASHSLSQHLRRGRCPALRRQHSRTRSSDVGWILAQHCGPLAVVAVHVPVQTPPLTPPRTCTPCPPHTHPALPPPPPSLAGGAQELPAGLRAAGRGGRLRLPPKLLH